MRWSFALLLLMPGVMPASAQVPPPQGTRNSAPTSIPIPPEPGRFVPQPRPTATLSAPESNQVPVANAGNGAPARPNLGGLMNFDYRAAEVRWVNGRWELHAGDVWLKDFGGNER